jgi:iron complex transport system substrate-binding protein
MRGVFACLFAVVACSRSGDQPAAPTGERIVSLMPSGTEIVAALGADDLLVGVDRYSEFPPRTASLPKVGDYLAPDLEAIVRLRPTIVIVDDVHGQVAAALHDRGIETLGCSIHTLPDIQAGLRAVGARLRRTEQAEVAVTAIQRALDAAAARRPARHPKVLAVIDREAGGIGRLVAAGPGSYLDELLAVVGGDNALAATGQRYPQISLEEVLRARPDVILDVSQASRGRLDDWDSVGVPAVASHRVVALSEPYVTAPSPRVALALDALARAIH